MKDKIELNSNAIELRRRFGEDTSSPINIFPIINNIESLTLLFYPMSERISGLCVRIDKDESLIAVNSTLSYGRQRFTVSHEMYHLYFQNDFRSVICGKEIGGTKDVEERNADTFASFLLAPYDALKIFINIELHKRESKPVTLNDIVRIEQYFGMSRQATLYRLVGEGFISIDFANSAKTGVIQSARRLGVNDTLYVPTSPERQYQTTGSYIELVERLKELEKVSQGKYEELLLDAYRSDIVYNLSNESEKYD